jgi:hypothetical protein
MRTEVEVVWLIDNDPPSPRGGRAFYPAAPGAPPPDPALMATRFAALRSAVAEAGAPAVVTLHTSPRHRHDLLSPPYLSEWAACLEAGMSLALHPHEDLADGRNLYGDAAHLGRVIGVAMECAGTAGLPVTAFRSGTFAWNPALPAMLQKAGIALDLSPGPGLVAPEKNTVWPAEAEARCYPGTSVRAVPIGWSGEGSDLDQDYLFVERQNLAGLCRIWDRIRARVQRSGRPALCNLLSHGFGLADPAWRALSLAFLEHLRTHGGTVILARAALETTHADCA